MKFSFYNPSPSLRNVGDCAVRAVAKATGKDWDGAYAALCVEGFDMEDMPNSNAVFGRYLLKHGFRKGFIEDSCLSGYTVAQFADDHPEGTYVLCLSGHVVCVVDGVLYDTWRSDQEIVLYFFRKDDQR